MRKFILCMLCLLNSHLSFSWGFYAHRLINEMAIYTLPPEMIVFYKHHGKYITDNAVNPDKRRSVVKNEGARHYIDLDVFENPYELPKYWRDAAKKYTADTLLKYGIVPWHIYKIKNELTEAFKEKDINKILRLSADLGHYIADAHVPLHTTRNYNGQLTGQHGIHGFWESRLPELFGTDYNFLIGKASYIEDPQKRAWDTVHRAHAAVDSVLSFEKIVSRRFSEDKKYSYEEKGKSMVKVYSYEYSKSYHDLLNGQVERQMRASIKMVGDFWYTCWVDAGQPDLKKLLSAKIFAGKRQGKEAFPDKEADSCH